MIAGIGTHNAQLAREGPPARMSAPELVYFRRMAMLDVPSFAAKLNLPADHLEQMEAGTRVIPKRFDEDVYTVVGVCINEMVDPGPMRDC